MMFVALSMAALAIYFEEVECNASLVPIAKLVDDFYAELQHQGEQRSDRSVLSKRLNELHIIKNYA